MSYASQSEASIQSLFNAVNSGFLGDASIGLDQIASWTQILQETNTSSSRAMASELNDLAQHFRANNLAAASETMQRLGEQTAVAANAIHSFEGTGDKLRELSQKLISAAGNLRHIARVQPVAAHH
jgi:hypothetical protein